MSKSTLSTNKPLKGLSLNLGSANIGELSTNNLNISPENLESLMDGMQLDGVTIINSEILNTVIGASGANNAFFTQLTTLGDVILYSSDKTDYVSWNAEFGILTIKGAVTIDGCATIGNIEICGNTIKAINTNGDVILRPNGIGSLVFNGPVNNTVSSGNYLTNLANGNVTFIASDYINLTSISSGSSISTFSEQTFSTINGDIILNTDTSLYTKQISNIKISQGNILLTTTLPSNIRPGDIINITSSNSIPTINGPFVVTNIVDATHFNISTGTGFALSTQGNYGTFIKNANNSIFLNASENVSIPQNIPLVFGNTENSISGNTSGLIINSQGDIILNIPETDINAGDYKLQIPQDTKIQLGTSGNNSINFDGTSLNVDSYKDLTVTVENSGYFNIEDVFFSAPNPYISYYPQSLNDISDRGVQFSYWSGGSKLGWFGYKQESGKFTFLTNAVNTNEIITGDLGTFDIGAINVDNLNIANNINFLSTGGSINMNCGYLYDTRLITGCEGILNLDGDSNVNISTGNRIALISDGDIYIPNNIPITLGTTGSYIKDDIDNNLILTGKKNMLLNNQSNGSIIVGINTKISFDGTSIGNQSIFSSTTGNLNVNSNKNILLTTTGGNIIIPSGTNSTASSIQFGTTSQTIYGNTGGLYINSTSTSGSLNFIATSNVNISNSVGNIVINTLNGDIQLFSSSGSISDTSGNIRLYQGSRLVFNISGSSNSIRNDSNGNLMINGPGITGVGSIGNLTEIKNTQIINLTPNTGGNINIPYNVKFNFDNFSTIGNRYITANTTSNFNINNNLNNGNLNLTSRNTNIFNTGGTTTIINDNMNINTNVLTVNGTSGDFNLTDVYFDAQNPYFANYTQFDTDPTDRGFLYKYWSAESDSESLGWFGYKQDTREFTFYQDAINTNDVITGTLGTFALGSLNISNNISFLTTGNMDMSCGTISNLNTILGCHGVVNVIATSAINLSTSNLMLAAGSLIQLPYNIPLAFGNTANSISMNSGNNNMTINVNNGSGTLVLNSNVQINGTVNNVYSTITNYQDPILSIGGVSGPIINDLKDRGIEFKWANTSGSSTGFFGFQNSTNRFVYYTPSTNTNEIISGTLGDVQFRNGYYNNLDVNCGTIANVSLITACAGTGLSITSTLGINLSTSNILIPNNSTIIFGTTGSIGSSNGNLNIISNSGGIILNTSTSGNGYVQISENSPLYFGAQSSGNFLIRNTSGDFAITNTSGNILLNPYTDNISGSYGNVIIPTNDRLVFGNTTTRISSDGTNLQLYGYSIGINSTTTITFNGNVNIIGNISSNEIGKYIYPLGTSEQIPITSIVNSATVGNRIVTTKTINYLAIGDSVNLTNTDSTPLTNGTFTVNQIISPTSFSIPGILLSAPGTTGTMNTSLKTYQGKEIGLELDFWQNDTGNGITSGSAYYQTGFLGRQHTSGTLVYYSDATIINDVVTDSTLGNMLLNELSTKNLSGIYGTAVNLTSPLFGDTYQIRGSNFDIEGGSIDNTPIGQTTAQSGRFNNLSSTISTSLNNVTMESKLMYSIERFICDALNQNQNPLTNTIISYITVNGLTYITNGTMGSSGLSDGQIKKIIISSIGPNCEYNLAFPPGKLIAPNPLGGAQPTQIKFKRKGQHANLMWDDSNAAWILDSSSCYVY
jgi:hypothetical protein